MFHGFVAVLVVASRNHGLFVCLFRLFVCFVPVDVCFLFFLGATVSVIVASAMTVSAFMFVDWHCNRLHG